MAALVEARGIGTRAGGEARNALPCFPVEHEHRLIVTTYEDAIVLRIDRQAGGRCNSVERQAPLYFKSLWIEDRNLVLVFEGNIDDPVGAAACPFSVAFDIDGADDVPGCSIDGGDVVGVMIVREDPSGVGIEVDSVRSLAYIDLLDHGQLGEVEHRDLILFSVAGEAVLLFGSNGDPVHAGGVFDGAYGCSGIGVEHIDAHTVGDIDAAGRAIDGDVVPPFAALNGISGLYFIVCRVRAKTRSKQNCHDTYDLLHIVSFSWTALSC